MLLQKQSDPARETRDAEQTKEVNRLLYQNKQNLADDMPYHMHRIQVYGSNRFDNRWFLNKDPPQEVDYLVSKRDYASFVISFNEICKWNMTMGVFLRILALLYYPLYIVLMKRLRKNKYQIIKKFTQNKINFSFWRAISHDLQYVKTKLTCSDDYTVAFLDIFNYQSPHPDLDTLNPLVVSISGEGCFSRPFYLPNRDPMFMVFVALFIHRRCLHA